MFFFVPTPIHIFYGPLPPPSIFFPGKRRPVHIIDTLKATLGLFERISPFYLCFYSPLRIFNGIGKFEDRTFNFLH